MLGKYNTNVVLPRTISELTKQISGLKNVSFVVVEPHDSTNLLTKCREIQRKNPNKTVSAIIMCYD